MKRIKKSYISGNILERELNRPDPKERWVLILDLDASSIRDLLEPVMPDGCGVLTHADLEELLKAGVPSFPSCLLLGEARHNGRTGLGALEVLAELRRRNLNLPVVVLAQQWNLPQVVEIMRAGAAGFLARPVNPAELHDAVKQALERAGDDHRNGLSAADASARVFSLNHRELEVVRLVVNGKLNKEIADHLDLALVTVKVYRSRAMKKLGAGNPAEMVNIANLGGLDFEPAPRRLS
jgi:FixJ family two-component response regulator